MWLNSPYSPRKFEGAWGVHLPLPVVLATRFLSVQWRLTAVFPNALHHTGRNLTEDKLFTVSPKIRHYAENGLLKIIIKKTIVIIIIKNERLVVHTGDSIAGAAESSVDHMCRSPTSGFVFPWVQVLKMADRWIRRIPRSVVPQQLTAQLRQRAVKRQLNTAE